MAMARKNKPIDMWKQQKLFYSDVIFLILKGKKSSPIYSSTQTHKYTLIHTETLYYTHTHIQRHSNNIQIMIGERRKISRKKDGKMLKIYHTCIGTWNKF